jgi:TonB-linked SusC/RagA family outer membrane protein
MMQEIYQVIFNFLTDILKLNLMKPNHPKGRSPILFMIMLCLVLQPVICGGVSYELKSGQTETGNVPQTQLTVSGTVTDEAGLPMPEVNVIEKGTYNADVTDKNGIYSIKISKPDAVIVFSFVGYSTREVAVNNQTVINIRMEPETSLIGEVVVVGYGTQKKTTLSGSVAAVKGTEIVKSPALNVTNSIAGKISGLVAVGQSGEPGEDYSRLYIRGRSTLNDNTPLVVIDGIPNRSLERIDPATIENISVLKDASAAIYGSQAANGVILVTTKRGSSEKLEFSANYTMGFTQPTKIPDLCNSAEYATLVNEVDYYDQQSPTYSPSDIQIYSDGSDPWSYPVTDWFKEVLKPWSMQQNGNITMSGGSEKVQSYVSFSSRSQDGFFYNSASKYAQNDLRTNIDFKVSDNIKLSIDASMRMEQREGPTAWSAAIFRDLMTALPIQVAEWPTGEPGPPLDPTTQNNPLVQATPTAGVNKSDTYVMNFNAKLQIKIPWVKGLTWSTTGALDKTIVYTKNFSKKYALYKWDGVTYDEENIPYLVPAQYGSSNLKQQMDEGNSYLINSILDYRKEIGERHYISAVAGFEVIENSSSWFAAERRDFTNSYPEELDFGDVNQQYANGSNPGINRWLNFFGRANYTLDEKYIAEFVWRYQGSSKFSPETRWGFFPGISLAYRISEESFWKDGSLGNIINTFKLRGSWGKTGNDLIEPYQFYSLYQLFFLSYVTADQVYHQTYNESQAGNTKAQWEEARQLNAGIDMSFLDSKLTLTADYFNNLRTKILITQTASVPTTTGMAYILPDINLGEVRNQGFDFDLVYKSQGNKFQYQVGLNGCYAKNKVLFFDEAEGYLPWQTQTGHPMYSGLYYEATGIFKTPEDLDNYPHLDEARTGDVIFKDVSGDGQITGDDMARIYKNDVPTLTGGLSFSCFYSGFDFSVMFQGQAGAVRYIQDLGGKGVQNWLKSFYDNRWTESNPYSDYPRTYNRNDEYWVSSVNPNTYWLRNTDFVRLKDMEIGYTIPSDITNRIKISNLRLHVGGMNLLTWSPDFQDYDPELEPKGDGYAGQGYPLQRIVTAGLSIKF